MLVGKTAVLKPVQIPTDKFDVYFSLIFIRLLAGMRQISGLKGCFGKLLPEFDSGTMGNTQVTQGFGRAMMPSSQAGRRFDMGRVSIMLCRSRVSSKRSS